MAEDNEFLEDDLGFEDEEDLVDDEALEDDPDSDDDSDEGQTSDSGDEDPAGDNALEGETEQIDIDGSTYDVPASLKPVINSGLEIEALRDEVDQERQQIEEDREAQFRNMDALIQLRMIDARIKQYEDVDWNAYYAEDIAAATAGNIEYQQLKRHQDQLADGIRENEEKYSAQSEEKYNETLQKTAAAIKASIPDWGREKSMALTEYAVKEYGFTRRELGKITDPRLIRLFNDAEKASKAKSMTRAARSKASLKHAKAAKSIPNKVRGASRGASASLTGEKARKISTSDWISARNKQLNNRNR